MSYSAKITWFRRHNEIFRIKSSECESFTQHEYLHIWKTGSWKRHHTFLFSMSFPSWNFFWYYFISSIKDWSLFHVESRRWRLIRKIQTETFFDSLIVLFDFCQMLLHISLFALFLSPFCCYLHLLYFIWIPFMRKITSANLEIKLLFFVCVDLSYLSINSSQ